MPRPKKEPEVQEVQTELEVEELEDGFYANTSDLEDVDIEIPDTGEDAENEVRESARTGKHIEIAPASRREQRKLYNAETYLSVDGERIPVNKRNSERHKEYLELIASASSANIRTGVITGDHYDEKNDAVYATVNYGKYFDIYIPVECLTDISKQPPEIINQIRRNERTEAYLKIVRSMQNAIITFRVRSIDENEGIAFADHIEAMNRDARYWYTKSEDGKPPRIRPGDEAEAYVMNVNSIGIWVEVHGGQAFIMNDEIDWLRRDDITKMYAPGDTVKVKILEIHPKTIEYFRNRRTIVDLVASVKQCSDNPSPNVALFNKYNEGDVGTAKVMQINDKGQMHVIYKERIAMLVPLPTGNDDIPDIGDTICVKIDRKVEQYHTFYGLHKYIIRKADK